MPRLMPICLNQSTRMRMSKSVDRMTNGEMKVCVLIGTPNPFQKMRRLTEVNARVQAEKTWKALPAVFPYGRLISNARQSRIRM